MLMELLYALASALSAAYLIGAIAEAAYLSTHGEALTPLSGILSLKIAPVAVLASTIFYRKYHFESNVRRRGCKLPTRVQTKDPILGIDWPLSVMKALKANRLLEMWHNLFSTHGNTWWVSSLGEGIVTTNEPENIKSVLMSDMESWPIEGPRQKTVSTALGPGGILAVNGKQWHDARAIIRPSFVRNQLADLACFERHVSNFMASIPKDGSTVDVQKLFFMMTIDSATEFMFGQSTNILTKPTEASQAFTNAFDRALIEASSKSRSGYMSLGLPTPTLNKARKVINSFVDSYIQNTLKMEKTAERDYVFLDQFIKTGAPYDLVRDQSLNLILGGRDTTASALSYLIWTLARRPDVVQKLRAEISELNGELPTWDQLKEMRYLNQVIKENLRVHPPVATNSRTACRDTVLPLGGGPDGKSPIFIPKGTICRFLTYSTHRRKDIYGEDADEFRPERWDTLRTSWEYLPFSGGPRICIGQQFALTQMLYAIVRIFQTFRAVEARDDQPMEHRLSTTISLVNGCHVGFTLA